MTSDARTLDDRSQFYKDAAAAISAGELTAAERDVICRPGTRKARYWARHLADLRSVLADRRRRTARHDMSTAMVSDDAGEQAGA